MNTKIVEAHPMSEEARRVLIIEDDSAIVEVIKLQFRELGYTLEHSLDGESGLAQLESGKFHLVILDLGLPGIGGIEVCKRIRAMDRDLPVLMLTARGEELDKVLGFTVGADDYMTKPFSERELAMRVQALMKRAYRSTPSDSNAVRDTYEFGPLFISIERHEVKLDGKVIELTPTEFSLLAYMVKNAGKPIPKQKLLEQVSGYSSQRYEATLSPHISRLRSKLETDPTNPKYIKTAWGIGYYFSDQTE